MTWENWLKLVEKNALAEDEYCVLQQIGSDGVLIPASIMREFGGRAK